MLGLWARWGCGHAGAVGMLGWAGSTLSSNFWCEWGKCIDEMISALIALFVEIQSKLARRVTFW